MGFVIRFVAIARVGMMIVAPLLTTACGDLNQTPAAACALPNELARIISTAIATEPPIALQQGISGPVTVEVTLDAKSNVTAAVVVSSPSVLLDASAIDAAKRSTYQTAIENCIPVPSMVNFGVRYPVVPLPPPGP